MIHKHQWMDHSLWKNAASTAVAQRRRIWKEDQVQRST